MNFQKAIYIFKHYPRLMSELELKANTHYAFQLKLNDVKNSERHSNFEALKTYYLSKGKLSDDSQVIKLLDEGYEVFVETTASRIIEENPGQIYFNKCEKCNSLAESPQAKHCNTCGHDWHHRLKAELKFEELSSMEDSQYLWITGKLNKECGQVCVGDILDMTPYQINVRAQIEQIITVSITSNSNIKIVPSFGIRLNSKEENLVRSYLKKSGNPIMIYAQVKKRVGATSDIVQNIVY